MKDERNKQNTSEDTDEIDWRKSEARSVIVKGVEVPSFLALLETQINLEKKITHLNIAIAIVSALIIAAFLILLKL